MKLKVIQDNISKGEQIIDNIKSVVILDNSNNVICIAVDLNTGTFLTDASDPDFLNNIRKLGLSNKLKVIR